MKHKSKLKKKEVKENLIEEKTKLKRQNGITLIALVITIIVLLILAGISIGAITGDNGIINQAQNASDSTERSSWEEQIDIAIIDAESKHRNPTWDDVIEELKNKDIIDDESQVDDKTGAITTNEPSYVIEDKLGDYLPFGPGMIADKNETYEDENGDTATIPGGFEILEDADTVDEGLVIQDEQGNQFVWIPVENENIYVRNKSYRNIYASQNAYTDTGYLPIGIQPELDNSESNELAEKNAVLNHKGFYISRYEAGKDASNNVVSRSGENVYITEAEKNKELSKAFINNENVKSALCSGIQWDVTMNFINKKLDGMGNVFDVTQKDYSRHKKETVTGQNEADKVCNIYDLEGNYTEYIAEKTSNEFGQNPYVCRGGIYFNNSSLVEASYRYNDEFSQRITCFSCGTLYNIV